MKASVMVGFDFENWLGQFLVAYYLRHLGDEAERERLMFALFNGIKGMIDSKTHIPSLARALFDPIQHFGHGHIPLGQLRCEINRLLVERKSSFMGTHAMDSSSLVSSAPQHSAGIPAHPLPFDSASSPIQVEPSASNAPTTVVPEKNAIPSPSSSTIYSAGITPSNPSSADSNSLRSIVDMGLFPSPTSEALSARRKRKNKGSKSGVRARLYQRFQKKICILARDMTQEEFDTLSRSEKALITRKREENALQGHARVFEDAPHRHEALTDVAVTCLNNG